MLQFVANDLGVAIVPSELARSSARTSRLHFLPITASGVRFPKWRIVVVFTAPRGDAPGKTIVSVHPVNVLINVDRYPDHRCAIVGIVITAPSRLFCRTVRGPDNSMPLTEH
jgi:hypothetical protein